MKALYLVKERIEAKCLTEWGEIVKLTPGNSSKDSDSIFGTYTYAPNRDYDQPYIHADIVNVMLYHNDIIKLFACVESIVNDLSKESYVTHTLNTNTDGIRFNDIIAKTMASGQNILINGKNTYYSRLGILLQYVEV